MDRGERFRAARGDASLAVVEGFHAFKHALRFGAEILEAAVVEQAQVAELARSLASDVAESLEALVQPVSREEFAGLSPTPHPTGVIALARRSLVDVGLMLADPSPSPVVLLEHPRRLENVGAVVRVAAAAGAAGVLTTGDADPWNPVALRGSAGLHFAVPVARTDALPATDRPIAGLDPEGEALAPGVIPPRAILAFGTEREGLTPALRERAHTLIRIPMRAGVSSLNLATSVAIALYAEGPPAATHPDRPKKE